MEYLVGYPTVTHCRLVRREQDAGELPVLRVHTNGSRNRAGLLGNLAIPLDLVGKIGRQIGVAMNFQLLRVGEVSLACVALAGIEFWISARPKLSVTVL